MKRSFLKWLIISALLGVVVPIGFLLTEKMLSTGPQQASNLSYSIHRVMRVMWPSSIFLMATEGIEGTPRDYLFILISVAVNALLYSIVGSALWLVKCFAVAITKK
jgi:hypothetical protein